MGYSVDLRQCVVKVLIEGKHTYKETAAAFGIDGSTVNRYLRAYRETASLSPKPHSGGRQHSIKDGAQLRRFKAIVDKKPDATLEEMKCTYNKRATLKVGKSTIVRALKRLNYTRKKRSYVPCEQATERVQASRCDFQNTGTDLEPNTLVFIDEAGVKVGTNREYGRSLCGKRVNDERPCNWKSNVTMVAGLTLSGIVAGATMTGAMNGFRFIDWLRKHLLPQIPEGTTIIMDNLSSHHRKEALELIKENNCKPIFLPPYSPDLNPIEMAWSKIKSYLRGVRPRSERSLKLQFHQAIKTLTQQDALGYFRHCGYQN